MAVLFLDIGNSHIKLAEKRGITWEILFKSGNGQVELLHDVITSLESTERVIISSVRDDILEKVIELLNMYDINVLTSDLIDPVNLDYETPSTMGMDRYLTCYGAVSATNSDVICVDAGTACTIDWMTHEGLYRGGVIMPGLNLFHSSVKQSLPELPSVVYELPDRWPGKSTVKSLQWGINGGFLMAIEGFIKKYLYEIEGEAEIFVTGGDSLYLKKHLQMPVKVNHRPHLHFDGMEIFWDDLPR